MARQIHRTLTTSEPHPPERPQIEIRAIDNSDVYLSDINVQLSVQYSQSGGLIARVGGVEVSRFDPGSLAQNKSIIINTGGTLLRQGALLEILGWTSGGTKARAGISVSYSQEPTPGAPPGAPRSLFETNQELSVNVGGLDEGTRDLLNELEKVKAAIGARRITIDAAEINKRITNAINALSLPDPNPDDIDHHLKSIFDLVGDQELANDRAGIARQLEGILEAINQNEITVDTTKLEDLIDDLTDKTVPDDFGISDGIKIADLAPVPAAATAPLLEIKGALTGLLDGFNLQELARAIATLKEAIPKFEAAAPDPDLITAFKLIRLRLERQAETVPDAKQVDNASLFPRRLYEPGTHTNVLATRGHSHFIASMAIFPADTDNIIIRSGSKLFTPGTIQAEGSPRPTIDAPYSPPPIIVDTETDQTTKRIQLSIEAWAKPFVVSLGDRLQLLGGSGICVRLTLETSPTSDFLTPKYVDHTAFVMEIPSGDRTATRNVQGAFWAASFNQIPATGPLRHGSSNPALPWMERRGDQGIPPAFPGWGIATAMSKEFADFKDRYFRIRSEIAINLAPGENWDDPEHFYIGPGYQIAAITDLNAKQGRGTLSFEFQDAFGDWYPVIPGSELGSIGIGEPPLVVRFSEMKYGFPLPAGQDIFRARLDVQGGRVPLGVGLLLLS